jgi:hypothetical protein
MQRLEAIWSHFNEFYRQQYGQERWDSRLLPALEAPTRYCCMVNRYADPQVVTERLLSESADHEEFKQCDFITSVPCLVRMTSEQLVHPFPSPTRDFENRTTHYLLDAASVFLATEVLNPRQGDRILRCGHAQGAAMGRAPAAAVPYQLLPPCRVLQGHQHAARAAPTGAARRSQA